MTTGSTPRHLPGAIGGNLPGVFTLRDLADVDAMRPYSTPGKRGVIVGGGYIGLEGAAVAAKLGLDVTVLEMAPRILQRVAAPETSSYFRNLHISHGVKILESTGLDRLLGETHVTAARLTDGREVPADFVMVGVGITPDTTLAEAAGLTLNNGIETDDQGRLVMILTAVNPIDKRFLAAAETLDYRLWLARNMGGGYRSVYCQPLAAPGEHPLAAAADTSGTVPPAR